MTLGNLLMRLLGISPRKTTRGGGDPRLVELHNALRLNGRGGAALKMGSDTSFTGTLVYPKGSRVGEEFEEADSVDSTDLQVVDAIRSVPCHYAGMSSVTATILTEFKWTAQNNLTGSVYNPVTNPGDIRKSYGFGTGSANNLSGGGDEIFSFQQAIVAGATATVDLTGMTNVLQQAGVSIARIKGYQIRLLSGVDDTSLTPVPNANSKLLVTNRDVATPCQLDFGNGGSGLTLTLTTGAGAITGVAIGVAGSGYPKSTTFLVSPNQAGGSGGAVTVTTDGTGVPTTVAVAAGGTGYSNATVPSTVTGHYTVLTGGAHMYFDPAALGFCIADATHKNIKLANLDGVNAVTAEIDVLACTS